MDERIGALRIEAALHRATIILYNNGRGVVIGQSSRRIAEMAVRHWAGQLEDEGALA
jgi:GH24 family phage-related lysozyme (muramidase)